MEYKVNQEKNIILKGLNFSFLSLLAMIIYSPFIIIVYVIFNLLAKHCF